MKKIITIAILCILTRGVYAELITGGQITTTTIYQVISDTGMVQFVTNVPANLKIDDTDLGEVQSAPYKMKYGQYKAVLTAENYYPKRKKIEVEREKLTTYKMKLLRKPKKCDPYVFHTGFQQEVNLNYALNDGGKGGQSGLVDYVAGWRFNDWVFLGAGTGLHVFDDWWGIYGLEIPLYAQTKIYFMKTRWRPFFITSVGMRLGCVNFNNNEVIGAMFNTGFGVEYCISNKYAINYSMGYDMQQRRRPSHGFSMRLGFVF